MIPLTFPQAVDIYGKVKGLTPEGLRLMVDDFADQMELFATTTVMFGDKLLEAEQLIGELNEINLALRTAVDAWMKLGPDELRAEAERRTPKALPLSMEWRGSPGEMGNPALAEHLGEVFGQFLADHDAARAASEAKHPSNFIDTTAEEATESDEIDPNSE